jgi:two-component system cell cycle response regulator PopA
MLVSVRSSSARSARALQETLAAAGVETAALVGPAMRRGGPPEDVAILDARPDARDWAISEAAHLADVTAPPGALVAATTMDAPPSGDDDAFDGWIAIDGLPALMQRDLRAARRAAAARHERALRVATATALGAGAPDIGDGGSWRALYIGEPHPFFLALERALGARGGRLEAAFSSFMGFDFLHEDSFDAVALNAGADSATALALCGALRRNARLHHLPTIMLADANAAEIAPAAIERGASLIVGRDDDRANALAWTFDKIRRGRREAQVEAALGALRTAFAGPSSLMQAAFLTAHMERLALAAHATGRPLTLAGLRVQLAPGARRASASGWRRGLYQVCEIAGRLIRVEDSAALLDGDLIAIALPGATAREGRATAERVASVTECTAFAAGEADAGPIVLEQSVIELALGESGAGLLSRLRGAFDLEDVRA